jgi:small subunit ribosomal protein S6
MESRVYEITFIVDSQLEQNQIDEIVQKLETTITDSNGEIVKKDLWGKRRLAYEINRKQYGYYVYLLFNANGEIIDKIERDFKLNESVYRFLTIRLSKAAIKQMDKKLKKSSAVKEKPSEAPKEVEKKVEEVKETAEPKAEN